MYKIAKQFIKRIFPKRLLYNYESFIRSILYLFYTGNKYQCNICNKNLKKFISLENGGKLCPYCGSNSRNRRLWKILTATYIKNNLNILDFSPSRCLYRKLKKNTAINYVTTDLSGNFIADNKFDITNIAVNDQSFDLVICYHILEHIIDDLQAMKELYRILKFSGTCIIQTPFKSGEIYEDYSITAKEDRLKHFGQDDHVRIYSVEGLKNRLLQTGFNVNILEFNEEENNLNGLNTKECILICNK